MHELFVILQKQSHMRQIWQSGHCTHRHLTGLILLSTANEGWRAIYLSFFSATFLHLSPLWTTISGTWWKLLAELIKNNAKHRHNEILLGCSFSRKSFPALNLRFTLQHRREVTPVANKLLPTSTRYTFRGCNTQIYCILVWTALLPFASDIAWQPILFQKYVLQPKTLFFFHCEYLIHAKLFLMKEKN